MTTTLLLLLITYQQNPYIASFTLCSISLFYHPMASGVKGGYWLPNQAERFPPSSISKFYFTHLFYASVVPDPKSYEIKILPGSTDDKWMSNFTKEIKDRKNQVSLLSIGGRNTNPNIENEVCAIFSSMARDQGNRSSFIKTSINVARQYGFDGLDLDWEFPKTGEQMESLKLLFNEWHDAIIVDAKSAPGKTKLFLSAAVYYEYDETKSPYPIETIQNCVDFVGPRCYDYHGSWDTTVTAEHASLPQTEKGINTWTQSGLPASKLVMGLPLFGKTWHLTDPKKNGVGDLADAVGKPKAVMTYKEIVTYIKDNAGATVRYDKDTKSAYCYLEDNWIGYEDNKTIAARVEFAREKKIGGYFLWALGDDCEESEYSATQAASNTWDGTPH